MITVGNLFLVIISRKKGFIIQVNDADSGVNILNNQPEMRI